VKALKADPAVSADNTTTPPSGRQSETPTAMQETPFARSESLRAVAT